MAQPIVEVIHLDDEVAEQSGVSNSVDGSAITAESDSSCHIMEDDDADCYGELILLGYNGSTEGSRPTIHGRRHRSKMVFKRRDVGNGVKKGSTVAISAPPKLAPAVQDVNRHAVSYAYHKTHTVVVEYVPDPAKDMFQIGRSSEDQIDFTIVDTWLTSGAAPSHAPAAAVSGGARRPTDGKSWRLSSAPAPAGGPRAVSSTISRYACRLFADRDQLDKAYVFAAGFDASKNIFLGEKATKWQKLNGESDGLTTNGVLILHPDRFAQDESGDPSKDDMYVWREVSVDGDIYSLRESRSAAKRGELVPNETNQLQDGTLIDLCGATLLWRSAAGLRQSPSRAELERRLDELNAGKPQCPVNLNTLIIPRRSRPTRSTSSRQPYAYLSCGHVQGKHNWGVTIAADSPSFCCPICIVESDKILQLTMGMESAFHLDSESLDYAFNPCGHVASKATVSYWSRIPLPHGTNSFHPVCPFCTTLLSKSKPFVRLIFQDHCFDTLRLS